MSNTTSVTDIISTHSNKLNSLLEQLDSKLRDTISKLTPEQKLELHSKLSKQYGINLDNMIKRK